MAIKQGDSMRFSDPTEEISTGLGFSKIIHPAIIEEHKFELPRAFVKKHGYKLSEVITLEVPNGDIWKIKLSKTDGNMRFGSGWKDFVDHHSISTGHVLFFRYEGCSNFQVVICDMRAVEIDYPRKIDNHEESSLDRADTMMPVKSSVNLDMASDTKSGDNPKQHQTTELGEPSEKHGMLLTPLWIPQTLSRQKPQMRESSAIRSAMAYKSENPSFMIVMKKAYVHDNFALNLPFPFIEKYLGKISQDIMLCVIDGVSSTRLWRVNCCVDEEVVKLSQWKEFSFDNDLKEHDVCVFELTNTENVMFKISIFRGKEACKLHQGSQRDEGGIDDSIQEEEFGKQVTDGCAKSTVPVGMQHQLLLEDKGATEAVHGFKTDHPSFIVGLSSTYIHRGYLHIPAEFAHKYLPTESKAAVVVNSEGKTWYLRYKFTNKAFLCNGWDAVVLGNELKESSFCAFELINEEDDLITLKINPLVA